MAGPAGGRRRGAADIVDNVAEYPPLHWRADFRSAVVACGHMTTSEPRLKSKIR